MSAASKELRARLLRQYSTHDLIELAASRLLHMHLNGNIAAALKALASVGSPHAFLLWDEMTRRATDGHLVSLRESLHYAVSVTEIRPRPLIALRRLAEMQLEDERP